jgi:hypothetical protein
MVMLSGTGYIAKSRSRKTKRKLGIVCVKKAPRREKRETRNPALPISLQLTGICAVKRGLSCGSGRQAATMGGTRRAERGHEDGRYMERRAGKGATSQSGAPVMFYNNNR